MQIPVRVEQGSHHPIAKYIKYNRHVPYPTIEATMGRGAPEFTQTLEAIPTGQNLPHLTLPQQRLLDCNMAESRTIDRALAKVDSWPLQGELQHFRTLRARVAMLHEETLCSRGNLATATQELQESIDQLSRSNIYVHIQQALEDENDEFTWLATSNLCAMMKKIVRRLVESADSYCRWCQRPGHDEVDCWVFQQCRFCERFGHATKDCRTPHRLCSVSTGCHVPLDHSNYHSNCKARPYYIDDTLGFALRLDQNSSRIERWLDSVWGSNCPSFIPAGISSPLYNISDVRGG